MGGGGGCQTSSEDRSVVSPWKGKEGIRWKERQRGGARKGTTFSKSGSQSRTSSDLSDLNMDKSNTFSFLENKTLDDELDDGNHAGKVEMDYVVIPLRH